MSKNSLKFLKLFFRKHQSLSTLILPIWILQISYGESWYCSPLTWNSKRNQILFMRETKPKSYLIVYKLFAIVTSLRSIAILYKAAESIVIPGEVTGLSYKLVITCLFGFLFGINWVAALHFGQEHISSEACTMFNRIMAFSNRHNDIGYRNFFKFFVTFLSYFWIILMFSYILIFSLTNAIFSCLPPFMGSLFGSCRSYGILPYLLILSGEIIGNIFIVYHGFLCGGMLISSIIIVKEYLLISTWKNDATEALREYQQLQLILRNLNNAFQHVILPCIEAVMIVLGSTSLYLMIAFGFQLPILLLLMSTASNVLCMLVESVGFSVAGKVNKVSNGLRANLKRDSMISRNRILSRTLLSLKEMKVMFGYSNFMEVSTCLEFINFTANVTLNLLLAFKIKAAN